MYAESNFITDLKLNQSCKMMHESLDGRLFNGSVCCIELKNLMRVSRNFCSQKAFTSNCVCEVSNIAFPFQKRQKGDAPSENRTHVSSATTRYPNHWMMKADSLKKIVNIDHCSISFGRRKQHGPYNFIIQHQLENKNPIHLLYAFFILLHPLHHYIQIRLDTTRFLFHWSPQHHRLYEGTSFTVSYLP